jgi:hypothetical protein
LKQQTAQFHATMKPLIKNLLHQGHSLAAIAKELNGRNIPTACGGLWYPTTVRNILLQSCLALSAFLIVNCLDVTYNVCRSYGVTILYDYPNAWKTIYI